MLSGLPGRGESETKVYILLLKLLNYKFQPLSNHRRGNRHDLLTLRLEDSFKDFSNEIKYMEEKVTGI